MTPRAQIALCALWLLPAAAAAQPRETPERVRVRVDTLLRSAPRYELRVRPERASAAARFWHRVDQLPVYERVTLDAHGLLGGAVETHVLAWAAEDALMPEDGPVGSGDFATAYARAHVLPTLHAWGGRRFLTWGLPGGLHLDGLGLQHRTEHGLHTELLAGRPVTSVFSTLGAHSEYEEPTFAYGARVGYDRPGELSASLSFMQRAGHGIVSDRTVMGSVAARPHPRLDLAGSGSVDVAAGLEEARAQAAFLWTAELEPTVSYAHAEPQKLLPAWSLLAMFASDAYDEGALGATLRLSRAVTARAELGVRRAYLPGGEHDDEQLGHRTDLMLRVAPHPRGIELVVELSRRQLSDTTLSIGRVGMSLPAYRALRVAPELSAAIDEHDGSRAALLLRGSAELPLGRRWQSALTVDLARTPLALSEVRALARVSYQLDTEAR